tara:strand:- start:175 stop:1284 length:1110 start_codon:yes stop_codon:yes gene_type:complete
MDKLQEAFEQEFAAKIQSLVTEALEQVDVGALVTNMVKEKLEGGEFQSYVNDTIKQHVRDVKISDQAIKNLETTGAETLRQHMPRVVQTISDRVDSVLSETVDNKLANLSFPEASIDPKLLDTSKLRLTKSNITDLKDMPGIEDIATGVQLTVMDDTVVVEDTLVAQTIQAHTLIVDDVPTDKQWYQSLKADILHSVPAPEAPIPPKDWSWEIAEVDAKIDVAIKRQGQLKELEVTGEALLSDVLYTTPGNRRVGINTMDPSDALVVWDNETEICIGKHKAQEGYVGTRRRQDINIGANNKVGITVRSDGSVVINKLVLNERLISTADAMPGYASKRGNLVLNTQPDVGKHVGWVCIDGIRWAGFGRIE